MQSHDYRYICRRHPDLVAMYESPGGELALLLDDTLLPPASPLHRGRWFEQTRSAAERIRADLRGAGLRCPVRVVQLLPYASAAEIVGRWRCHYDRRTVTAGPGRAASVA